LIVPSVCYENFPKIIAEAYANAVPVVANKLGSMREIITEGETGMFFEARKQNDLKEKVESIYCNETLLQEMSRNAYREYQLKYSPEQNYQIVKDIYKKTIERK